MSDYSHLVYLWINTSWLDMLSWEMFDLGKNVTFKKKLECFDPTVNNY